MTLPNDELNERVTTLISDALVSTEQNRRTELLVTLLHRAAVELNKVARAHATESKGQPAWGAWAGLQNTTRSLVLQASTCRDVVKKIAAPTDSQEQDGAT